MRNRYFDWLCEIVGREDQYYILLEHLHTTEFYSLVQNDDNRAKDGVELRWRFSPSLTLQREMEEGHNTPSSFFDAPCTVLEMLIALSFRMADELEDCPMMRDVAECFWILIGNLGLTRYDDQRCRSRPTSWNDIYQKLEVFLSRNYRSDGIGGLFPLEESENDQREIEIWYQMAEYLTRKVVF